MNNLVLIHNNETQIPFKDVINKIFNEHGHVVFLLDRTLKEYIFDDWLNEIKEQNIEYIPFAISPKEPNLFFLLIDNKVDLEKRIQEISEYLESNLNDSSAEYYLYGFGAIDDELPNMSAQFKKKLKLKDKENIFLFRWYDPRVSIYLHKIFDAERIEDLFSIFKFWMFTHPSGIYTFINKKQKKSPLYKIEMEESKQLDLIEISNFIYVNLFKEISDLDHIKIFESLVIAVNEKGLSKYQDIYLYGHFSSVINPNFLDHEIIKNRMLSYESFELLIESILEDEWLKIKKDLSRENYDN